MTNFKSKSEVGHAKNVANFEDLTSFCNGYGATYNPVNDLLKLDALQRKFELASDIIKDIHDIRGPYQLLINERQAEFDIKSLSTRIINALEASGADAAAIKDVRTIVRKIQGRPSVPQTDEQQPGQEIMRPRSNSQQSYDRKIDQLTALLGILADIPVYTPNEPDLRIAAIKTKISNMKSKNTAVINAYTTYSNMIIERQKILYDPITGLVAIAKLVKKYVKSLYGVTSPQYQQISSLQFITFK